jgi:hypothetical protein
MIELSTLGDELAHFAGCETEEFQLKVFLGEVLNISRALLPHAVVFHLDLGCAFELVRFAQ